jgi:hypothetical protein
MLSSFRAKAPNQPSILRNQLEKDSRSRQAEVGGDKGFQLEREGSRSWKVPLGKAGCQIKVADLA